MRIMRQSMIAAALAAGIAAAQNCPAPVMLSGQNTLNVIYIIDAATQTDRVDTEWLNLSRGDKEGFISTDGKHIIEPQYESSGFYWQNGLMWVSKDDKWGALNREGKEVIAPQYAAILPFRDGLAAVGDDADELPTRLIDTAGKVVFEPENIDGISGVGDGMVTVSIGDKYGYMNLEGELVIEAKYDYAADFSKGIAVVGNRDTGNSGVIDKTGKEIIAPKYAYILHSTDGYLVATDKEGKTTLFTAEGKALFEKSYDSVGVYSGESDEEVTVFVHGATIAVNNGKSGLLDEAGKKILPFEYEDLNIMDENLLLAKKDGKFGIIDRRGKVVVPFEYEWMVNIGDVFVADRKLPNEDSIKNNATRQYSGVLDKEGKEVIPAQYDYITPLSNKQFVAAKDGKSFLLDAAGKPVSDTAWDYIGEGLEGMLEVSKNDRWGFINEKGEVLIEPQYDYVNSLRPDAILVKRGAREQLLDRQGCVIIDMAGQWKK